jgi:hypothetical protein
MAAIATSLAWAVVHSWHGAVPADPTVDVLLRNYLSVAPVLPLDARVGFLPVTADPTLATTTHVLAQYALAPRVVDLEFRAVTRAVTGPGAPPAADDDARLAGFDLILVGDGGIRVYRRRP